MWEPPRLTTPGLHGLLQGQFYFYLLQGRKYMKDIEENILYIVQP
jgi:hypothetical protein